MRINEAKLEFELMLMERGLNPDQLDLWDTWRIFTAFLRRPVQCENDSASVQARHGTSVHGQPRFYISLIRQLGEFDEGRQVPFRHIVAELGYDDRFFAQNRIWSLWTQDFGTLGEFISAVQERAEFERALSISVLSSELYEAEC